MTAKELLSENRDSVISSIKFIYKIWKNEDVKAIMVKFLAYAEENIDAEKFASAKNTKTLLKNEIEKMRYTFTPEQIAEARQRRSEEYINKDKRTSVEMRADWMDREDMAFDIRTKRYHKI